MMDWRPVRSPLQRVRKVRDQGRDHPKHSSTLQLRDEQCATDVPIERAEHAILRSILAERKGNKAALRELTEAFFCQGRVARIELVSGVATTVHNYWHFIFTASFLWSKAERTSTLVESSLSIVIWHNVLPRHRPTDTFQAGDYSGHVVGRRLGYDSCEVKTKIPCDLFSQGPAFVAVDQPGRGPENCSADSEDNSGEWSYGYTSQAAYKGASRRRCPNIVSKCKYRVLVSAGLRDDSCPMQVNNVF
jgi:hypothetical protein